MSAIRSRVPRIEGVGAPATPRDLDLRGAATWIIGVGVVVYLGLIGGGFDTTIWGGVGVVVWWVIVLVALVALDVVRRPSRLGWLAIIALIALAAWSAVGMNWSSSAERTLNEVGRVSTYLGVLLLAIAATRGAYARQLAGGISTGIVVISVIALLSRLRPSWFPASVNETSSLLPGARNRLSYPLDYWNALAALVALGIPLLLSAAVAARARWRRAIAAAALPPLALTLLLTISRGGVLALAVALLTYLIVARRRLQAMLSVAIAGAGTAIVSAVTISDHDLRQGLNTALAHHQGSDLLVVLISVCVGTAAVQFGVALLSERPLPLRLRRPSLPLRPRLAIGSLLVVAVVAFLVFGGPHQVSHAWASFKRPYPVQNTNLNRLGSLSGNGRYQYWRSSVKAMKHRPATGIGAGTWEFWWTRYGRDAGYAMNAHSLVFETLAENGIPGGILIIALLATVVVATIRRAWRAAVHDQAALAAGAAACAAAAVSLATDWSWQVAVIPVCMLVLAGPALGSNDARVRSALAPSRAVPMLTRLGIVAVAAGALASIGIPLATTSQIQQSQAAFGRGAIAEAFRDARSAASLEPYGATPWLQQAVVLESAGHLAAAEAAARRAQRNDSADWREPLILARIRAERGEIRAALASARRALTLNPSIRQYLP